MWSREEQEIKRAVPISNKLAKTSAELCGYLDHALSDEPYTFDEEVDEKGHYHFALFAKIWNKSYDVIKTSPAFLVKLEKEQQALEVMQGSILTSGSKLSLSSSADKEKLGKLKQLQERLYMIPGVIQKLSASKERIVALHAAFNSRYEKPIDALLAQLDATDVTEKAKDDAYKKLMNFQHILIVTSVPFAYTDKIAAALSKHSKHDKKPWYEQVPTAKALMDDKIVDASVHVQRLHQAAESLKNSLHVLDFKSHGMLEKEFKDRVKSNAMTAYAANETAKSYRQQLYQQRDALKSELCILDIETEYPKNPRKDSYVLLCEVDKPPRLLYYDAEGYRRKNHIISSETVDKVAQFSGMGKEDIYGSPYKKAIEQALRQQKITVAPEKHGMLNDEPYVQEQTKKLYRLRRRIKSQISSLAVVPGLCKEVQQLCKQVYIKLEDIIVKKEPIVNEFNQMNNALALLEKSLEDAINEEDKRADFDIGHILQNINELIADVDVQNYYLLTTSHELVEEKKQIEAKIASMEDKISEPAQKVLSDLTKRFMLIEKELEIKKSFADEREKLVGLRDAFNQRLTRIKRETPKLLTILGDPDAAIDERRGVFYRLKAFEKTLQQVGLATDKELAEYAQKIRIALPQFTQEIQEKIEHIRDAAASKMPEWRAWLEEDISLLQDKDETVEQRRAAEARIISTHLAIRKHMFDLANAQNHLKNENTGSDFDFTAVDKTLDEIRELQKYSRWLSSFVKEQKQSVEEKLSELAQMSTPKIQIGHFVTHDKQDSPYYTYLLTPPSEKTLNAWGLHRRDNIKKHRSFLGEYKLDKIEEKSATKSYSFFWRMLGWKNSDTPVVREEQSIEQQLEVAVCRLPQRAYEQSSQFSAIEQKKIDEVNRLLIQQHIASHPDVQKKKVEVGGLLGERLVAVISQLEALEEKVKKSELLSPIEQMQQKILANQKNYLENAFIQLNRSDVDNSEQARLLSHEELLNTSKVRPLEKELLASKPKVQFSKQAARGGLFQRQKAKTKDSSVQAAKKPSVSAHGLLSAAEPSKIDGATTHQSVGKKLRAPLSASKRGG